MKRSFSLFAAFFIFASISTHVLAQEQNMPHANISSGTAAFLFSLNGFQGLALGGPSGNGNGDPAIVGGFGGRYYFNNGWALRGIINFASTSNGDTGTAKKTTSLIGLAAGIEYHMHQLYSTDMYVGGGAGYNSLKYTNVIVVAAHQSGENAEGTGVNPAISATGLGLTIVAGFDWYIWNGIALGGEYSLGYSRITASHQNPDGTSTDLPTTSNLGITGGGNIHLVVVL